jgi:hypothetical protein
MSAFFGWGFLVKEKLTLYPFLSKIFLASRIGKLKALELGQELFVRTLIIIVFQEKIA